MPLESGTTLGPYQVTAKIGDDVVSLRHREPGDLASDLPSANESDGHHDRDYIPRQTLPKMSRVSHR